jgi:hypothetical protein
MTHELYALDRGDCFIYWLLQCVDDQWTPAWWMNSMTGEQRASDKHEQFVVDVLRDKNSHWVKIG